MLDLRLLSPYDPDYAALLDLLARLANLSTVRLGDTPRLLRQLNERLHGMQVPHLQLVAAMARSQSVFTFIAAEGDGFSARLHMLRSGTAPFWL